MKRHERDREKDVDHTIAQDSPSTHQKQAQPTHYMHGIPPQVTNTYLNFPRRELPSQDTNTYVHFPRRPQTPTQTPKVTQQDPWLPRLIESSPEDAWTNHATSPPVSYELEDRDPEGHAAFLKSLDTFIVHEYSPSPLLLPSHSVHQPGRAQARTQPSGKKEQDLNSRPKAHDNKSGSVEDGEKDVEGEQPLKENIVPSKVERVVSVDASALPVFDVLGTQHSFGDLQLHSPLASLLPTHNLINGTQRQTPLNQPLNFSPCPSPTRASQSKSMQANTQADANHKEAQHWVGRSPSTYNGGQHHQEHFQSHLPWEQPWAQPWRTELQHFGQVMGYQPFVPMPSLAPYQSYASIPLSAYPDPRDHMLVSNQGPTDELSVEFNGANDIDNYQDDLSLFNDLQSETARLPHDPGSSHTQGRRGSARTYKQILPKTQLVEIEQDEDQPPPSLIPPEPDWTRLGPGGAGCWPREWIALRRGRVDGMYHAHYPRGDIRIAGGYPLEAYCYYRPNHVWGDGLRPFLNHSDWSGVRIWNSFAQEIRDLYRLEDGTFSKRAQNWIQQAWCREKKKIRREEESRQVDGISASNAESQPQRTPKRPRVPSPSTEANKKQKVPRRRRAMRASKRLALASSSKLEVNDNSSSEDIDLPQRELDEQEQDVSTNDLDNQHEPGEQGQDTSTNSLASQHKSDEQGQDRSTNSLDSQQEPPKEPWWAPVIKHHMSRLLRHHRQRNPGFVFCPQQVQQQTVMNDLRHYFDGFVKTYWHGIPPMQYNPHPIRALQAVYQQLRHYGQIYQAATEEEFCNAWIQCYMNFIGESLNSLERNLFHPQDGSIQSVQRNMSYDGNAHAGLYASPNLNTTSVMAPSLRDYPVAGLSSMQHMIGPCFMRQSQFGPHRSV